MEWKEDLLKRCNYREYDQMPDPKPMAINVARWMPPWFIKKYPEVKSISALAPSKGLLKRAKGSDKKRGISWLRYMTEYFKEVEENPLYTADILWLFRESKEKDIYLLCWEPTEPNPWDTLCHTNLIILNALFTYNSAKEWEIFMGYNRDTKIVVTWLGWVGQDKLDEELLE